MRKEGRGAAQLVDKPFTLHDQPSGTRRSGPVFLTYERGNEKGKLRAPLLLSSSISGVIHSIYSASRSATNRRY